MEQALCYAIGGELYHHGVKGMKWGVRRYQPYGVGYVGKTKGKFSGKSRVNLNNQGSSLGLAMRMYKATAPGRRGKIDSKALEKRPDSKSLQNRTYDIEDVQKMRNNKAKANAARAAAAAGLAIGAAGIASAYAVHQMRKGQKVFALATMDSKKGMSAKEAVDHAKNFAKVLKGPAKKAVKAAGAAAITSAVLAGRKAKTGGKKITYGRLENISIKKDMKDYRPDEKASSSLLRSANKKAAVTGALAASTVATAAISAGVTQRLLKKGKPAYAMYAKGAGMIGTAALKSATAIAAIRTGMEYTAAGVAKGSEKSAEAYKKKKASKR